MWRSVAWGLGGLGLILPGCQLLSGVTKLEVVSKELGAECAQALECQSGFCSDGVCCDTSCDGPCVACQGDGAAGLCTPHPVDTDPEDGCEGQAKCDGTGSCAGGVLVWSKSFGAPGVQLVFDVAVDATRNIVIVGTFGGTLSFGGDALVAQGERDVFVAKFRADGKHLWSKRFGDVGQDGATSVAIDAAGNVIVTGQFQGNVDFGDGTLLQSQDLGGFVAAFQPDGIVRWSKSFGGTFDWTDYSGLPSVEVGPDGFPVIAGRVSGDIRFDHYVFSAQGAEDIYVAKLSDDSSTLWATTVKGPGTVHESTSPLVVGLAVDSQNRIALGGNFQGTLNFGSTSLQASPQGDIYLAKLDAAGKFLWAFKPTGTYAANMAGLGLDTSGQVTVAGNYQREPDFGGTVLPAPSTSTHVNFYVARLSPDGVPVLVRGYVGGQCDVTGANAQCTVINGLAVQPSGNLIVSGMLRTPINFGGQELVSLGGVDVFIAKLNANGDHVYSKRWGDAQDQAATAAAIDLDGNFVLTGYFGGTLDFGGQSPLVSVDWPDIFLAKFEP
jgi:hypothetical protein